MMISRSDCGRAGHGNAIMSTRLQAKGPSTSYLGPDKHEETLASTQHHASSLASHKEQGQYLISPVGSEGVPGSDHITSPTWKNQEIQYYVSCQAQKQSTMALITFTTAGIDLEGNRAAT